MLQRVEDQKLDRLVVTALRKLFQLKLKIKLEKKATIPAYFVALKLIANLGRLVLRLTIPYQNQEAEIILSKMLKTLAVPVTGKKERRRQMNFSINR